MKTSVWSKINLKSQTNCLTLHLSKTSEFHAKISLHLENKLSYNYDKRGPVNKPVLNTEGLFEINFFIALLNWKEL